MDAGGMGKCVVTGNRFVYLHVKSRQMGEQPRRASQLLRIDIRAAAVQRLAYL
ncbi:hypothetical protein D3C74_412510 [compost metagenome]